MTDDLLIAKRKPGSPRAANPNNRRNAAVRRTAVDAQRYATQRRGLPSGKTGNIVAQLEHRLATGHYRFGQTLSALDLAQEFDSSRQPVSAAISHLRTRGYVEVIPQVGCRCVSPTAMDIGDMFLALGKIEGVIAALAAARHEPEEGEILLEIARSNNSANVGEARGREQYIAGIDEFHEQLMFMSRSPAVCDGVAAWNGLSKFYLWQGVPKLLPAMVTRMNTERLEIAAAVVAGSRHEAGKQMEAHVVRKPVIAGIIDSP